MNDLLNELFSQYKTTDVILICVLLFIILKEISKDIDWIKEKLFSWHKNKNNEENTQENIEGRISTLENHDLSQYNKLSELNNSINEIKELIKELKKETNEFVVVTCRSQLYRIHKEAVGQGFISKECLKTFTETGKKYEAAGGNDIFHEKLYPEVIHLPIKNEDEN